MMNALYFASAITLVVLLQKYHSGMFNGNDLDKLYTAEVVAKLVAVLGPRLVWTTHVQCDLSGGESAVAEGAAAEGAATEGEVTEGGAQNIKPSSESKSFVFTSWKMFGSLKLSKKFKTLFTKLAQLKQLFRDPRALCKHEASLNPISQSIW
jgi:hypothetical protein